MAYHVIIEVEMYDTEDEDVFFTTVYEDSSDLPFDSAALDFAAQDALAAKFADPEYETLAYWAEVNEDRWVRTYNVIAAWRD